MLAIPQKTVAELPKNLFKKTKSDLIVIDCTNYFSVLYGKIDDIENGLTESIWVQRQIGHPVVKVFNTILAGSLANSASVDIKNDRIALSIFGDNESNLKKVSELVDQVGFDPVVVGSIEDSWKGQPGSPIYCTDLKKDELQHWASRVERKSLPSKRDANMANVMSLPKNSTWQDHVQTIRKVTLSE